MSIIKRTRQKEVTVMEMDEFYKTEFGQEILADLSRTEETRDFKEHVDNHGYAIKRGDNYFLVYSCSPKTPIELSLTPKIEREFVIHQIKRGNHIESRDNPVMFAKITLRFGYKKEKHGVRIIPHPRHSIETQVLMNGRYEVNNDLGVFDKFIKPDPHWFAYFTHYATRQEVLNGTARASFMDKAKHDVSQLLARDENNLNFVLKGVNKGIKGLNNYWKERRVVKEITSFFREA